ncbi:MAG: hypothetical protein ABF244_00625 [Flavobacteriaceae bacterium]
MKKGVKIGILIGSIGVLGTIGYLAYNRIKKSKEIKKKNESNNTPNSTSSSETNTTKPKSKLVLSIYRNTPFKNKTEGNAFRNWVNDTYPKFAKEIDLDRTGEYNNDWIRTAYAKYGDAYLSNQLYGI